MYEQRAGPLLPHGPGDPVGSGARRLQEAAPLSCPPLCAADPTFSFCKMGSWTSGNPGGQLVAGADHLGFSDAVS